MPELLLELLSEEIPARMQARAGEDLKRLVCERLEKAQLTWERAEAFVTPRRVTLVVEGLPERQPDTVEERKGPRVGSPEKAVDGFFRACGLASLEKAEVRETGKGSFYFAVLSRRGQRTADLLSTFLPGIIWNFPWPKSMRWGDSGLRWVRPLQSIVCILDGSAVPIILEPGSLDDVSSFDDVPSVDDVGLGTPHGIQVGYSTTGHRFLAPGSFEVRDFADYKAKLYAAKVIVDPAERRRLILESARRLAAADGLRVREDEALLDEVTGLIEWPVPMLGSIDPTFMDVPPEVLITAMRAHQKYFSLLDADGGLAPRFVLAANTEAEDGGRAIVAGNERVLRARLSDAKFFWDEDRKRTLESRLPKLSERVFHAKLGSDLQRSERLALLARALAPFCGADPDLAERAARLCKADLTTAMVGEFPELQGLMGRYYALHDGEPAEVADAIADHYAPQGPSHSCPAAPVSISVALADKLDTLAGFFAIDERPTGSKDPYALRRAALGVIRLIIETGVRVPLRSVLATSYTNLFNIIDAKAAGNAIDQMEIVIEGETFTGDTENDIDLIAHYLDDSRLSFFVEYEDIIHKLKASPEIVFEIDGRQLLIDLEKTIRQANTIMWKRLLDSGVPPELEYAVQATNQLAVVERDYPIAELAMLNAAYRLADDLLAFFADRLKVHLREQGVRHDLIAAVFAGGAEDDIVRLLARVDALRDFLDTEDGANLLTAYRRASNIVRIEENKDGTIFDGEADGRLLEEQQEIELYRSLAAARAGISGALSGERFGEAMAALAGLRAPVDAFFDHVTVNCRESRLRVNRLRLLSQIRSALGGVADFSQIEG
jgi:glycyl-tRNA synthetase beta chain